MRRKKPLAPTLSNVIRLFGERLKEFKGESRRSYQKAFSSFQLYVVANYPLSEDFQQIVVENWVVSGFLQGLSKKTVSFYLDKIGSLYGATAHRFIGGKKEIFKPLKKRLKETSQDSDYSSLLNRISAKINLIWKRDRKSRLIEELKGFPSNGLSAKDSKESLRFLWGCLALKAGVLPGEVKGILAKVPSRLKILELVEPELANEKEIAEAALKVSAIIEGESPKWFAMRLRPKKKFESLIDRIGQLPEEVEVPELFYPYKEIVQKVGSKMVWKGRPVIHDVVFFKIKKSEIYPLFTHLYDIAWCYRKPGGGIGNYASIPERAMNEFKDSLGMLTPDFEVVPAGELKLKPGEEVVVVSGEYALQRGKVLKLSGEENGAKIYRISLLNLNGHWDIGIDARLLKRGDSSEVKQSL